MQGILKIGDVTELYYFIIAVEMVMASANGLSMHEQLSVCNAKVVSE